MKKFLFLLFLLCHSYGQAAQPLDDELVNEEIYRVVLDPLHRTKLNSQLAVPVVKIYKHFGDSFQKGDVLIQLDPVIFQAAVKKAAALLDKSRTQYEVLRQLYQDGGASAFELKEAEANVATSESELVTAKKNLESTAIVAPYNGKVVAVNIEERELPIQGKELIEIVDDEYLVAKLILPSFIAQKLSVGDQLDFTIHDTGKKFRAVITRISPVIDAASSTIKIEARIDNRKGLLKAGMSGTASFHKVLQGNKP